MRDNYFYSVDTKAKGFKDLIEITCMFGFKRKKEVKEDYVELFPTIEEKKGKDVVIEIEKLGSFVDSDRIQRKLRNGFVVFVNVQELKEKDIDELKRAIARIKKTCVAINGDIVGVGEYWIIATPSNVKINRQKIEVEEKEPQYISPFSSKSS